MGLGLENVKHIYLEGIANGNAREAVNKCTGHRYTQHSTGVGNGVEGFLAFFEPFLERNSKRDIKMIRAFEDGPWVFCHAYQSLNDGAAKWVTMDMFFTDDNGLILEHWDTITPFVDAIPSGENIIGGVTEVSDQTDSESAKLLVREFTKQVLQEGDLDKIDQFVAQDLVQHSPDIDAGRTGLLAWLASSESGHYEMLFNLFGQGNFVVTYGKRHQSGKDVAIFDLYRVDDGLIVEHWDNAEEILAREQWGNSGKF
ncbi:MAG: nuclear transport factor 2 family protein [Pseudomonadota bacterium]